MKKDALLGGERGRPSSISAAGGKKNGNKLFNSVRDSQEIDHDY